MTDYSESEICYHLLLFENILGVMLLDTKIRSPAIDQNTGGGALLCGNLWDWEKPGMGGAIKNKLI
jgi:hypothetical protein